MKGLEKGIWENALGVEWSRSLRQERGHRALGKLEWILKAAFPLVSLRHSILAGLTLRFKRPHGILKIFENSNHGTEPGDLKHAATPLGEIKKFRDSSLPHGVRTEGQQKYI